MEEKKSRGHDRTRRWTFIVYPESAPEQWRTILDDLHIAWIESPLHEYDVNADGEVKKPHWHILLMFEDVKSYEQIKEITDKLNAPIPQKCASARGMVRYMAHLDNPDKVQYNTSLIIAHGGADVAELLKPTSSDRYNLIGEMVDYVADNNVVEFMSLITYARHNRFDDWFPLLCDNSAYIINQTIKSNRFKIANNNEKSI